MPIAWQNNPPERESRILKRNQEKIDLSKLKGIMSPSYGARFAEFMGDVVNKNLKIFAWENSIHLTLADKEGPGLTF